MKGTDENRRNNMWLLEWETGSITAATATARLDWSHPQWSSLRNGTADSQTGKPSGMWKDITRKIEAAFGKPECWLDAEHTETAEIVYGKARHVVLNHQGTIGRAVWVRVKKASEAAA